MIRANHADMTLSDYLHEHDLTNQAFADLIGVSREVVRRYTVDVIPSRAIMKKIHKATGGKVQPNDFYDIGGGEDAGKKRRPA